uniref:Uncharacterized protein n=1 Tax=Arundo donax TaxID=35708 RepID=A0A0A9HR15_ARUDO
MSSVRCAFVH